MNVISLCGMNSPVVDKNETTSAVPGEEPFCMAKAAHYLERLARNQLDRGEPLEVSNCLPAPGPAMGHGFLAHDDAGVSFDPVPNLTRSCY